MIFCDYFDGYCKKKQFKIHFVLATEVNSSIYISEELWTQRGRRSAIVVTVDWQDDLRCHNLFLANFFSGGTQQ